MKPPLDSTAPVPHIAHYGSGGPVPAPWCTVWYCRRPGINPCLPLDLTRCFDPANMNSQGVHAFGIRKSYQRSEYINNYAIETGFIRRYQWTLEAQASLLFNICVRPFLGIRALEKIKLFIVSFRSVIIMYFLIFFN